MTFSIRPVSNFPVPDAPAPRRPIQWQFGDVDVGRRNTDIVNFASVVSADPLGVTIGVGEQVNVLTVGFGTEGG